MVRWKPEEIVNTSVFANIHPEDKERTQIVFFNLLNIPGSTVSSNARYLCKNGNYKWIEFTAINLLDEPAINGVLLNYRDISERKEAEELLLENEAKQRAMISNSADVIAIIDKNGVIRYKSPNIEKLFGWKPEELIGTNMWENIHPDEWKNTKDPFPMFVNMPEAITSSETRYRCKDGTYKWIQYTINNLLHDPTINGIMLNYHDITENKLSEDALKESERKFRNYLESAPYGIFILDKHGNYREVNKTACTLTGYKEDELTHMNISDLIAPESLIRAGQSLMN